MESNQLLKVHGLWRWQGQWEGKRQDFPAQGGISPELAVISGEWDLDHQPHIRQVEKQIIPGCELVGLLKSYNAVTWLQRHFMGQIYPKWLKQWPPAPADHFLSLLVPGCAWYFCLSWERWWKHPRCQEKNFGFISTWSRKRDDIESKFSKVEPNLAKVVGWGVDGQPNDVWLGWCAVFLRRDANKEVKHTFESANPRYFQVWVRNWERCRPSGLVWLWKAGKRSAVRTWRSPWSHKWRPWGPKEVDYPPGWLGGGLFCFNSNLVKKKLTILRW